ncbi:DUF4270 domain-containing protein [Hymenobacter sp. 5516J-16]|uniref:DUF4270 domain-containing protein n=1 Tax=Hymenobacter sublimis TaxID=2933777 RepID=A0ABY4J8I8_9BACT|nr:MULTISPECIES: DUF4270 family protein [Hymenobacter]UOQ75444.1 DUF4270 domain-containing protein [Hymenobacter sp. 5516J-16]UPL49123.1 DUF4270 domain-containing protein [Hymenobacter sublimis]
MNWPASASRLASVSLFAVSLLGLTTSCEEANDLGLELPGTSPISSQFLDLPIATYTVRQQPVETVNSNQVLVGRLRDTKVGTTTAQAYLNLQYNSYLSPADSLPSKFTGVKLDSVVLSIGFDKVYGTTSQPLRFDLGALNQPLDDRTVYNSASAAPASSVLLTNLSAPLNRAIQVKQRTVASSTTDTTTRLITTTVIDRVLRVRLLKYAATTALANSVFTALQSASFNQEKLDAVWKGIALTPSAGFADNIVAFNRSYNSRVVFYFSGTNASGYKSKFHSYSVVAGPLPTDARTTGPKYFTQLTTDFSGTALASLSSAGQQINSTATDGYTYLQDGTGLATRLEFQGLETLLNNKEQAVNRAELLLPIKQNTNGLFPYLGNRANENAGNNPRDRSDPRINSIQLYEVDASNQPLTRIVGATSYERLVQEELSSQNGQSMVTSVGNPAAARLYPSYDMLEYYSIPLTEYLQAYLQNRLDGERPSALLLSPILRDNPNLTLNRAQLDTKGIKLRVYYSKLR